ncbi:MAG: hypothetical protein OEW15_11665 [Nitrospirota bacterium]|nr:hypothetical protein [Nitrospirota bacterium]
MTNEFKIGDKNFKIGKLDAFRQFHIVRRISPLLAEVMPSIASMSKAAKNADNLTEDEKLDEFAKIAQPILAGLSKLSDADADYVLYRLLSVVEVEQPQFRTWAKIATDTGLVMQDLELPVLLQAAGRALMFNLSGFFALLPQK